MESSIFWDSVMIHWREFGKISSEKDWVQILIPVIQWEVARRFLWNQSLVQKHKAVLPADIVDVEFRMKK